MPGRGNSEWLADPNDYVFPTYLTTLTALIARTGAATVSWVGTSMGGLLGMVAAALPKTPVARLVVNDVGPVIEPAALARIAEYFGADPTFATYDEIDRYVRQISAPFGPLTDAQWAHVVGTNVRQRADGRWRLAYDPGIAVPFYLAHPRLERLERRMMRNVEGGSAESAMRILRHEAGHAIDTAYRLRRRKRWREVESPAGPIPALLPPGSWEEGEPRMDGVPALGQHTDAILSKLGYSQNEIASLRAAKAI